MYYYTFYIKVRVTLLIFFVKRGLQYVIITNKYILVLL